MPFLAKRDRISRDADLTDRNLPAERTQLLVGVRRGVRIASKAA
jgi:hypothetical protein